MYQRTNPIKRSACHASKGITIERPILLLGSAFFFTPYNCLGFCPEIFVCVLTSLFMFCSGCGTKRENEFSRPLRGVWRFPCGIVTKKTQNACTGFYGRLNGMNKTRTWLFWGFSDPFRKTCLCTNNLGQSGGLCGRHGMITTGQKPDQAIAHTGGTQ